MANKPGELIEAHSQTISRTFEDDPKAIHVHELINSKVTTNLLWGYSQRVEANRVKTGELLSNI